MVDEEEDEGVGGGMIAFASKIGVIKADAVESKKADPI